MEFLRRAIRQIRSQLGVLTTSQRLVVVLCVVIMGGAIFWMVRYAGQRVMVPLLNQPFTDEERQRIIDQFEDWQQRYDVSGDRILVPTDDRRRLIGRLGYAQLLPDDTSLGWASLLEESSIWEPTEQRETKNLIVLQTMLAQAIEEEFPGVESAKVFINKAEKRRVSNVMPMASASVIVTLSGGEEATSRLGTAIADFVSGANQNMKRENVSVIANGQKLKVIPVGEQAPSEYWESKTRYEQYFRGKIISILEVDNALVQVDVKPQLDETEQIIVSIPNEESGKSWLPAIQTSSSEQSSSNTPPAQGPGIAANVGSGGGSGAGAGRSETTEQSETTRQAFPGSETVKTRKAPGGITDITVTVLYPKTFFKQIARQRAEDKEAEPTDEVVQAQIDLETPELR
ncbi:MAG: hypothetical protein AMJ79_06615, partial [Phycisphaerae bacterium SM23_30]